MPRERTSVPLPHLRAWRLARYLTQAELAEAAGLMQSTIARLEAPPDPASGERQAAYLTTVGKLSAALGITRAQLVEEAPDASHAGRGRQEGRE